MPGAAAYREDPRQRRASSALRPASWVFLGSIVVRVLSIPLALDRDLASLFAVLMVGSFLVGWLAAAFWLSGAWTRAGVRLRMAEMHVPIEPSSAVVRLFIPFYNLYWIFKVNLDLMKALDGLLVASGSRRRAPNGLAMLCCILQVVPYSNFLLAPFAWAVYVVLVDRVQNEIEAVSDSVAEAFD